MASICGRYVKKWCIMEANLYGRLHIDTYPNFGDSFRGDS